MSTSPKSVEEQILEAKTANGPIEEILELALTLGLHDEGLDHLLRYEPNWYFTDRKRRTDRLRWIAILRRHDGWSDERIRLLLETAMTESMEEGHNSCWREIRRAFLDNDSDCWELFDNEQLLASLSRDIEDEAEELILMLGRLSQRDKYKAYALAIKATMTLRRTHNPEVVKVIRTFTVEAQQRIAPRLIADPATIPWMMELAINHGRHVGRGDLLQPIIERIQKCPWMAHVIYRWALQYQGDRHEHQAMHCQDLRRVVENAGWRFLRVEWLGGDLQIVLQPTGTRVVLKHDPRGERGEVLKDGDEVIIPRDRPEDWKPEVANPMCRVYRAELHPVAPPTAVMLADPDRFFALDNPEK